MFTQAISAPLLKLIEKLNFVPEMAASYLGRGTALALQLGHRKSEDLDFFIPEVISIESLMRSIQEEGEDILVLNQTPAHTEFLLRKIRVDIIRERISPRFPLLSLHPLAPELKMADVRDIGRMKLLAIASRGSKKDFVDLFCLTRDIIPLESLIALSESECREVKYSRLVFLKGLVDFEEAEQEPDPLMIRENSWEAIKEGLKREVRQIAHKIQSG
jgi:hypothetical protein